MRGDERRVEVNLKMTTFSETTSLAGNIALDPALRLETISDYQAFLDLETIWNKVVEAAGCNYPFLEHAWARTWWESFGAGSTLQIVVVMAGDKPIAIAPLIFTSIRIWGIKVRRLGFFYNAHVPRADFIIAQQSREAYRIIWDHIYRNCSWDVLQLCQLPEGSLTLEEIPSLAAKDGCQTGVWQSCASPYQPLCTSWNEYFDGLTAKHRSNLRNRFKRLRNTGPVEMELVTSDEKLTDTLETGLQLEAAGWKGKAHTAISSDPDVARFYLKLAWSAARRGWLFLHFLNAGPDRVAFLYCLSYKNRIYRLKSGYAPAYARYSPSNLLDCLALQNAFEQGITEYEFLGESDDWKLQWAKQTKPHYWLFICSHTVTGRLLYLIKFRLAPVLKKALRKFHFFFRQVSAHFPIVASRGQL